MKEHSLKDGTEWEIADGIQLPRLDKSKINQVRLSVENIPEGEYKTEQQLWEALFIYQNISIERSTLGLKSLSDNMVVRRMKMPVSDIEKALRSDKYNRWRISKSAGLAQQTIADIVPSLRVAMVEFMAQLKQKKKCETCGSMGVQDLKKMHDGLQFVVYVMDKFGLPKIDTSFAENTEDVDINAVREEAIALAKEIITWPNLAPQRIISALVDVGSGAKADKIVQAQEPVTNSPQPRPDEVIHTVRLPEPPVSQHEEVLGNDILEPVGENGLADGGFHAGGAGEASDVQNPEERNAMDFGREERQDTTGFGAEV